MDYKIIRTQRKTVGVSFKDGVLTVRCPVGVSRQAIEQILKKHEKRINGYIKRAKERDKKWNLTEEEIKRLRAEARIYFNSVAGRFAKLMGVSYSGIKITSAKKRFGSCNSRGGICFSYILMLYPEEAREYVVVHELAHLIELNHSKAFYNIIKAIMPDYRERKKLLY